MGHLLEPIAAHWFEKKTGNLVTDDTNLYQHADHPYALANIDRRYTRQEAGEPGILECKSCTYHKSEDWQTTPFPSITSSNFASTWPCWMWSYGAFLLCLGQQPRDGFGHAGNHPG